MKMINGTVPLIRETAILAITVAKSPFFLPYDDGYSIICNGQK